MSTNTATVRIRPLRFGFLVDPKDPIALRKVLQINTCLWGGIYNFLLPVPKKAPARYRTVYSMAPGSQDLSLMKGTGPSAHQLVQGLLDAFQPDFLVETRAGLAQRVRFERERVISLDEFDTEVDGRRRRYGVDLRFVCAALYDEQFRFVQRHPPEVIRPQSSDRRYDLLFAAIFGEFPSRGKLAACRLSFERALGARLRRAQPDLFHELLAPDILFPLRTGAYQIKVLYRHGWTPDPMLFYMDEREPYDIIEFWNLRAIGWRVLPLPRSLAPKLKGYSEKFIAKSHRPYPPPSNVSEDASFLCSRSCSFGEMQAYVSTLKRPRSHMVSVDPRVPRLWEEWGRHADHADPQVVEYRTESTEVSSLGNHAWIAKVLPKFSQGSRVPAPVHACTNVLESLSGGAPLIPWQMIDTSFLGGHLKDDSIWVSREGICFTSGAHRTRCHTRLPNSLNVFAAWASKNGLRIEFSPAGRVAEQVINALGGLDGIHLVGNEELLRVLDRMANGTLEVEVPADNQAGTKKRRLRKTSIPFDQIHQVLMQQDGQNSFIVESHLSALLKSNVLTLGMEVACSECKQSTWFALSQLATKLNCARCLREFEFPATAPRRITWSYRVQGPFAVENYAHGAYCVVMALLFLNDHIGRECTWIPSLELHAKQGGGARAEFDFAAFIRPAAFSHFTDPVLLFGECKTFGDFTSSDFLRMKGLARDFPGAVICFCTLKGALKKREKEDIAAIARRGRERLKTGRLRNPVLVLTGTELLGQFKGGAFTDGYPSEFSGHGSRSFAGGVLEEISDFTQQVHLGIESYHTWRERRSGGRAKGVRRRADKR